MFLFKIWFCFVLSFSVCLVFVVHLAGHGRDRDVLQPDAGEGGARGSITRKKNRNCQRRLIIFYSHFFISRIVLRYFKKKLKVIVSSDHTSQWISEFSNKFKYFLSTLRRTVKNVKNLLHYIRYINWLNFTKD